MVVMKRRYFSSSSWISQEHNNDRRSKRSKRNVRVWVYDTGILFLWRQQNGNYYSYTAAPFSLHAMHTHTTHSTCYLLNHPFEYTHIAQASSSDWLTDAKKKTEGRGAAAGQAKEISAAHMFQLPTCLLVLCMPLRLIKCLFSLSSK